MKKLKIKEISRVSKKIMEWGFFAVTAVLMLTVSERASMDTYDAARSYALFSESMEHILMSLAIVVIGAGIFDMNTRKSQE